MKSKKQPITSTRIDIMLAVSTVLAGYFFYGILILVQDVKVNSIEGAPNSFAAWPSFVLALYVLVKSKNQLRKYIAVSVITMLVTGLFVWLLGVTNAGSFLVDEFYNPEPTYQQSSP